MKKNKNNSFRIILIIVICLFIGFIIGSTVEYKAILGKSVDMDIDCSMFLEKRYCVLNKLVFYDRTNEHFFRWITQGKGHYGTIFMPNNSSLFPIVGGDYLRITID